MFIKFSRNYWGYSPGLHWRTFVPRPLNQPSSTGLQHLYHPDFFTHLSLSYNIDGQLKQPTRHRLTRLDET